MRNNRHIWVILSFSLGIGSLASLRAQENKNLIVNGSFAKSTVGQAPSDGWTVAVYDANNVNVQKEGNISFLHIINANKEVVVSAKTQPAGVTGGTVRYQLTAKCRVTALDLGPESWHGGMIFVEFDDADARALPASRGYLLQRTNTDWHTLSEAVDVPTGAKTVSLKPGLFYAAGQFDLTDIALTVLN